MAATQENVSIPEHSIAYWQHEFTTCGPEALTDEEHAKLADALQKMVDEIMKQKKK